jgi:hypothetical protein
MADPNLSNVAAIAANDAIVDLVDGGTTNPEGRIRIYDGSKPAGGPDEAIVAQTLLAELPMSNPAFGNSVDAAPNARATASAITDDSSADNPGTATWFRVVNRDSVAVIDGDVTATSGGGDLELNSVVISAGAVVSITAFTFDHLE